MSEKIQIEIRKDLYEKAEEFIKQQGGFNTVEELIEFLLEEAIGAEQGEQRLSREEEEEVKKRLKALGYI